MTGEVAGNAVMGCGRVWRDFPRGGSARSLVAGVGSVRERFAWLRAEITASRFCPTLVKLGVRGAPHSVKHNIHVHPICHAPSDARHR